MEFLAQHHLLKDTKFVLFGQSIGGAVCLSTAAAHPDMVSWSGHPEADMQVSGVIVENTFLSLTSLVPHVMRFLPPLLVRLLLSDPWDATKTLPLIPASTPVLFLSGRQDELVPQPQMIALRDLRASSEKARFRWCEFDGQHNDTYLSQDYWRQVALWIDDCVEVDVEDN
jgi:pimeloyl-ACP methyl ester carboxylesterase